MKNDVKRSVLLLEASVMKLIVKSKCVILATKPAIDRAALRMGDSKWKTVWFEISPQWFS